MQHPHVAPPSTTQYLGFSIRDEELAVPILRVIEIVPYTEPSRLPNAPPALLGVIGVRGNVVPAIDLGRLFGFGDTPITRRSCIVLIESIVEEERSAVGILVERVSEVADVRADALVPPPEMGMAVRAAYVSALYPARGRFVLVLDVDRILSDAEQRAITFASVRGDEAREAPLERAS